ncbi:MULTISPECIES: hypothetical protein [unclassified Sphingomonas]|uniref:hypothetical protein n=1 Tax=unclassified Sphingomonas TaxID=196159 RepID=UPI00092BE989|nr:MULTISPECIES: hypothetical protein [unclassified Sphingomonas]OJU22844.1 MAG: hypothetical protein BGN95_05200 [Sphingomonas sp. 66-10]
MEQHAPSVGVLAYGSLIGDPGDELEPATVRTIRGVMTPFAVEFARRSRSRGDAPTLVPHPHGARVSAAILVLDVDMSSATDMLWRRETRCSDRCRGYPGDRAGKRDAVQVRRIEGFHGIDLVLYTDIGANVQPLTAGELARLAIGSVGRAAAGLDGISYLVQAKANGIATPLSPAYEREILVMTGADDLLQALETLRARA